MNNEPIPVDMQKAFREGHQPLIVHRYIGGVVVDKRVVSYAPGEIEELTTSVD